MARKATAGVVQENYILPSLGKLYGEDYPSEISIRSMTTFEEKMRLGNQGFYQTMCNILNAVVTAPENFNAEDLILSDFRFLMYKMRVVSYGPEYKVAVRCPHCNKLIESRVDLDSLEVKYLDEDAKPVFDIGPLPRSGDILTCKYITVRDMMNIDKRAEDILKNSPNYVGDATYIPGLAARIKAINNEELVSIGLEKYVEQMNSLDSQYFQQAYEHFSGTSGMSMLSTETCSSCGNSFDFNLPITSEFFRPTFDF